VVGVHGGGLGGVGVGCEGEHFSYYVRQMRYSMSIYIYIYIKFVRGTMVPGLHSHPPSKCFKIRATH
jgi:hypothetical protein